jgi:hypothetical protein
MKIPPKVIVGILWIISLQTGFADTAKPYAGLDANHLQMFQDHPEQFKELLASKVPSVKAAEMMAWGNKIGAYSWGRVIGLFKSATMGGGLTGFAAPGEWVWIVVNQAEDGGIGDVVVINAETGKMFSLEKSQIK